MPKLACLIPARFGSSRLPGKPLARLKGQTVLAHTLKRAKESGVFSSVTVVSDHEGVLEEARKSGAQAMLVDEPCASGTERISKVLGAIEEDFILNLQADEPFIHPSLLQNLGQGLILEGRDGLVYTAASPILSWDDFENPNRVKVVFDGQKRALYFSRSPIPYQKKGPESPRLAFVHIGVYAMTKKTLGLFAGLSRTSLEELEGLEQLRALEYGFDFRLVITEDHTFGIDTPEDLKNAEALVECGQNLSS